jgi:hypothetical protein
MFGWGCGPILEALPMPLGSTVALFNPPAFAGAQIPRVRPRVLLPLAQMRRQEGSRLWTMQQRFSLLCSTLGSS